MMEFGQDWVLMDEDGKTAVLGEEALPAGRMSLMGLFLKQVRK